MGKRKTERGTQVSSADVRRVTSYTIYLLNDNPKGRQYILYYGLHHMGYYATFDDCLEWATTHASLRKGAPTPSFAADTRSLVGVTRWESYEPWDAEKT